MSSTPPLLHHNYLFDLPQLLEDNNNNNGIINNIRRNVYSPPLTSEQLAVFYHRQTPQTQPSMFGLDNAAALASIDRKLEQLINAVNSTAFKMNKSVNETGKHVAMMENQRMEEERKECGMAPTNSGPRNPDLYKTQCCRNMLMYGHCKFGAGCWYAHTEDERQYYKTNQNPTHHMMMSSLPNARRNNNNPPNPSVNTINSFARSQPIAGTATCSSTATTSSPINYRQHQYRQLKSAALQMPFPIPMVSLMDIATKQPGGKK